MYIDHIVEYSFFTDQGPVAITIAITRMGNLYIGPCTSVEKCSAVFTLPE